MCENIEDYNTKHIPERNMLKYIYSSAHPVQVMFDKLTAAAYFSIFTAWIYFCPKMRLLS